MIYVVHDLNPRAVAEGAWFRAGTSWFQDLRQSASGHRRARATDTTRRIAADGAKQHSGGVICAGAVMKQGLLRCTLLALGGLIGFATTDARAGGTLVVGMTAGDLPITTGNPDGRLEGYHFVGYHIYNSLVLWDLPARTRRPISSRVSPRNGMSMKPTVSAQSQTPPGREVA